VEDLRQASAGLDQCTSAEFQRFRELNDKYKRKFDFPFILAVKGKTRQEILAAFERRLHNPPGTEFEEALNQIARIARLRLGDLIQQSRMRRQMLIANPISHALVARRDQPDRALDCLVGQSERAQHG
jgi:hypothetical protein